MSKFIEINQNLIDMDEIKACIVIIVGVIVILGLVIWLTCIM